MGARSRYLGWGSGAVPGRCGPIAGCHPLLAPRGLPLAEDIGQLPPGDLVPDGSFEDPVVAPGVVDPTITGWALNDGGDANPSGVYRPDLTELNQVGPLASPALGDQVFRADGINSFISQGVPVTPGVVYNLHFALAVPIGSTGPFRVQGFLQDGGAFFQDVDVALTPGEWIDFDTGLSYTATGSSVEVNINWQGDTGTFGYIDNVRLEEIGGGT